MNFIYNDQKILYIDYTLFSNNNFYTGRRENLPDFPNIIHLVWEGDFPKKFVGNLSRICAMAAGNYHVICWVNHPKTFLEALYTADNNGICIGHLPRNLKIRQISELIELLMQGNTVFARNIVRIIELEASGMGYNYATVSDFLRLICLYFYGGIYLDCDSIPLKKFPHPSQIRAQKEPTQDFLMLYNKNNILISVPKHQLLLLVLQTMVNWYHIGSEYPQFFGMTWLDAKRTTQPGRRGNSVFLGPSALLETVELYSDNMHINLECFCLEDYRDPPLTGFEKMLMPSYSDQTTYRYTPSLGKLVYYCAMSWLRLPLIASTYENISDPHRNKAKAYMPPRERLVQQQKVRLLKTLISAALNTLYVRINIDPSSLARYTRKPLEYKVEATSIKDKFEQLQREISSTTSLNQAVRSGIINRFVILATALERLESATRATEIPSFIESYLPYIYSILSLDFTSSPKIITDAVAELKSALSTLADYSTINNPIFDIKATSASPPTTPKINAQRTSSRLLNELVHKFGNSAAAD